LSIRPGHVAIDDVSRVAFSRIMKTEREACVWSAPHPHRPEIIRDWRAYRGAPGLFAAEIVRVNQAFQPSGRL
jgi:hypothetical protein